MTNFTTTLFNFNKSLRTNLILFINLILLLVLTMFLEDFIYTLDVLSFSFTIKLLSNSDSDNSNSDQLELAELLTYLANKEIGPDPLPNVREDEMNSPQNIWDYKLVIYMADYYGLTLHEYAELLLNNEEERSILKGVIMELEPLKQDFIKKYSEENE